MRRDQGYQDDRQPSPDRSDQGRGHDVGARRAGDAGAGAARGGAGGRGGDTEHEPGVSVGFESATKHGRDRIRAGGVEAGGEG